MTKRVEAKSISRKQKLSFVIFGPMTRIIAKKRNIELNAEDIRSDKTYVLVCNHVGMADAFLATFGMPYKLGSKLSPYRPMIANRFFKGILGKYLRSLGGFPAHKHPEFLFGLNASNSYNKQGQTIMIFPEGRISKSGKRENEPKNGVSVISKWDNTLLIPIRLSWSRKAWMISTYKLAVGKPFDGNKMSPVEIMDVVYSLKFK